MKKIILSISLSVILLSGCASSIPEKVYEPYNNSNVKTFFTNGIPFAILSEESVVIYASLSPVKISGDNYMRLWLLYGNKSSDDYLLEPLNFVTASINFTKSEPQVIVPESPTKILSSIENEKQVSLIIQSIGTAFKTLSVDNTKIKDSKGKDLVQIEDKEQKTDYLLQKSANELSSTAYLFDVFKESINNGILRKNTVVPFNSVNGYIYFPLPKYNNEAYNKMAKQKVSISEDIEPSYFIWSFHFNTPSGIKTINFKAAAGE